ncbi:2-hydroxyacyl-CoA dehydratase [Halomonas sp. TRM85114]|uniref:2-hydroxyacyl-CoA dehydratase n=1 Tax=Halomonas jincaotanensis TaxID=2810616 RepID=UPI001BD1E4FE|nr:2-hydroxyacyl-CoA dehydratase [Halomonas jincaotanensis]MBS9403453.1 2-hydroxyacyl-CoA dehydratase [Halomonas jincaotanensis]
MAFRQVKDLLEWIHDFHARLSDQYTTLADQQPDERMKMALIFLAGREQRMRDAMARYLEDADEGLLTTWLIDHQNFAHPSLLERVPLCTGCHDVHDILANVMTAHQLLKDMYLLRAELAEMPEEAELFQQLATHQDAEARLQSRDIARLEIY